VILTGQHPSLDPGEHRLDQFVTTNLNCPGQPNPDDHVDQVAAAMRPLLQDRPDLLIVQGDTSSALGGALAGFSSGTKVAHVEAGLRTHDSRLPWPEEGYRTRIDAGANLLLAPTELASANLCQEGVAGTIHVTGNTAIDALMAVVAELPASHRVGESRRVLVTCHRRENWGERLSSIVDAIRQLASDGVAAIHVILPPNAHVAAAMTRLLRAVPNVTLLEPCSHREIVDRMRGADLILSDSGGMQEEAPALGVPLLILREKTERPEGIATCNMRLVGTATAAIVAEARRLLGDPMAYAAMSRPALPYGDGKAAPRIAAIIEQWLELRTSAIIRGSAPESRW
jgi:UDP-N-acetylglucosamine 2-epimerase (non-hydrolysing)